MYTKYNYFRHSNCFDNNRNAMYRKGYKFRNAHIAYTVLTIILKYDIVLRHICTWPK